MISARQIIISKEPYKDRGYSAMLIKDLYDGDFHISISSGSSTQGSIKLLLVRIDHVHAHEGLEALVVDDVDAYHTIKHLAQEKDVWGIWNLLTIHMTPEVLISFISRMFDAGKRQGRAALQYEFATLLGFNY